MSKLNRLLRHNAAVARTNRTGRMSKSTFRRRTVSWTFLLPSIAGVLLFFGAPFLVVCLYSVVDNPIRKQFVGMENFVRVWGNGAFRLAAGNSLKFTLIAVPLCVLLSLLLSIIMSENLPWKSSFRTAFLSPMMVPVASIVLIWQVLFHFNGLVNVFTSLFGMERIDWLKSDHAQVVVIGLFLWKNLGYNMILFLAALSSVSKDQIEAFYLDSSSEVKLFFTVKLRYLASTIVFVTIMSTINSFKVFREVYLLTGDYPYTPLYMLQHFMNNTFASLDYQKLSAAALIMSLAVMALIAVLFAAEGRLSRDIEEA